MCTGNDFDWLIYYLYRIRRNNVCDRNEKRRAICQDTPRHTAVMMLLNEVADSSVNGGGGRDKSFAKRSKPQFILLSISNEDCRKIVSAFCTIFTRDKASNEAEKYDVFWLNPDKDSGLLQTSVDDHLKKEKQKREKGARRSTGSVEEAYEKIVENDTVRTFD